MKLPTSFSKVLAVLASISGSIWIGSYLTRLLITYNLFEGKDLIQQGYINQNNANGILQAILPSILLHFVTYIIFIITGVLFFLFSKIKFREYGWLFIIFFSIIITMPFEFYLMYTDYKVMKLLLSGSFDYLYVFDLLRDRIKDLGSFSIVITLTYVSFFYFIIIQPLTKKKTQ